MTFRAKDDPPVTKAVAEINSTYQKSVTKISHVTDFCD